MLPATDTERNRKGGGGEEKEEEEEEKALKLSVTFKFYKIQEGGIINQLDDQSH